MPGSGVVRRLALRSARQRSGRIAATVVGVSLATAFSVAAFGVSAQLDLLVAAAPSTSGATVGLPAGSVVVTSRVGGSTEPTSISDALVDQISAIDGVLSAQGTYDQPIAVRLPRGTTDALPPLLRGLVFTSAWDPARWRIIDGTAPTGSTTPGRTDERDLLPVALDAGGQLSAHAALGDVVRLQTPTGGRRALVVATLERAERVASSSAKSGGTASSGPVSIVPGLGDAHIVLAADVLPDLLGAQGRVDRITVVPQSNVSLDALTARLRAQLPDGVQLASASDRTAVEARAVSTISGGLSTATWAFAALSALVAALLVSNTFSIVVAQRSAEIALARCVGMTHRQAAAVFLAEAGLVGLIAALLGLIAGVPLSMVAAATLRPGSSIELLITTAMVVAAVVVGLGVTLVAALIPALRAAKVAPLEALTASAGRRRRRGPLLWVIAPVLALLRSFGGRQRTIRMAVDAARSDPRRTGATISTLLVGVALMAMVLTVSTSLRAAIDNQFVNRSSADLYIQRRGVVRVDVASLEAQLGRPRRGVGFADISVVDGELIGPSGTEPSVTATTPSGAFDVFELDPVAALDPVATATTDTNSSNRRGAWLSESSAENLGVSPGGTVTLRSTSGTDTVLTVRGLYRRTALIGPAFVDRDSARAIGAEGTFEIAALSLPPGVPIDRIRQFIDDRLSGFNRLSVDTPQGLAAVNNDIAKTVTRLVLVLLSGSVLLGGLGAANSVSLTVLERRRELALLRAVGAGRAQVRNLITVETVILCGLAGLLGATIGAGAGAFGIGLAPADFAARAIIPWWPLAAIVVGVSALGVVAAAIPARHASRRDLLSDLGGN